MFRWSKKELRREEMRGIFTIGVLAFLVVLRFTPSIKFSELNIEIIDYLIGFWGIYILLITIALSDELLKGVFLKKKIDKFCEYMKTFAHISFILGIVAVITITIIRLWQFFLFIVVLFLIHKIYKKLSKKR